MDAVLGTARSPGWSKERLHYEFFGAEVIRSDADQILKVKLGSSGRVIEVEPGQTVIEAHSGARIEVPTAPPRT